MIEEDFVKVQPPDLKLTLNGIKVVEESLYKSNPLKPDPAAPKVRIGPIGTMGREQQDPELSPRLKGMALKLLGDEREGAAVGIAAENKKVPMIVAKSVSDYGDLNKNDQFRHYAAEISARFLLEFIKKTDIIPDLKRRKRVF